MSKFSKGKYCQTNRARSNYQTSKIKTFLGRRILRKSYFPSSLLHKILGRLGSLRTGRSVLGLAGPNKLYPPPHGPPAYGSYYVQTKYKNRWPEGTGQWTELKRVDTWEKGKAWGELPILQLPDWRQSSQDCSGQLQLQQKTCSPGLKNQRPAEGNYTGGKSRGIPTIVSKVPEDTNLENSWNHKLFCISQY